DFAGRGEVPLVLQADPLRRTATGVAGGGAGCLRKNRRGGGGVCGGGRGWGRGGGGCVPPPPRKFPLIKRRSPRGCGPVSATIPGRVRPISAAAFPFLLRALGSAPWANSHRTAFALPFRAKCISNVHCISSRASRLAPRAASSSITGIGSALERVLDRCNSG